MGHFGRFSEHFGPLCLYNSPCLCVYDISKARNRQAAGARCNKTVTLRRLCYRGPLRGPAPPKRGSFLIYYHEAAQGCTRGCNLGEGAGGRGVFGLSAGARFAPPPLAYPVGGTEEGGPLIRRGKRRDTFPPQGGRLLGRLEACGRSWASAQGRGLPPPVPGMFCDWYGGEEDPSSAAARAATPSPHRGEGFWGGARCIDGSREEEAGPFRVRPLFYSFSNR